MNKFYGIFFIILYGFTMFSMAARPDASSDCIFPQRWEGSWFLSGYQQSIHIKGSQFSYRGKCKASDGNKYLIVDEKGCHRCLVIYEKHKNVLQYKESECDGDSMYMDQSNPAALPMRSIVKSDHTRGGGAHPNLNGHSRLSSSDQYIMRSNDDSNDCYCRGREILQNLCDQIPGDALLYSLFREQAEPVKCPLKGPFTFTYNRGHGECKNPVSNIESCTDDSRLLLNFQACPDVHGTESAAEELTCLATWKDGNSRYLVGLVSHHHAISNEERFRCFVYEKISMMGGFGYGDPNMRNAEYKLAQSGDATCNGLDSAEVGSRIMTLRKPPPAERCDFPTWFKGPRHWHGLMGKVQYIFHPSDQSMQIKRLNGNMETRAFCEQINKQTSTELMLVVHHTTGCQSGYMCMMFYRRDTHVAEIQIGTPANRLEDACAPDHFDLTKLPFITLLANNPESQICPLEGLYSLKGAIGPPHKISRHKRNHNNNNGNNKGHNQHGHHHHDLLGIKRHGQFHINNEMGPKSLIHSNAEEELIVNNWPLMSRDLLKRKRRLARETKQPKQQLLLLQQEIKEQQTEQQQQQSSQSDNINPIILNNHNRLSFDHNQKTANNDEEIIIKDYLKHEKKFNSMTVETMHNENYINDNSEIEMPSSVVLTTQSIKILNQRNRRETPGCVVNYEAQRQLWIGCTEPNIIDIRPQCNDDGEEVYYCHGTWTENTTTYLIAKHSGTQHGVCVTYQPLENKEFKIIIGDSCLRSTQKPSDHHLVVNVRNYGKCGDPSSTSTLSVNLYFLVFITSFTIVLNKR